MTKCPKCGFEVADPLKTWSMIRRPSKLGNVLGLTIGLYECTNCGTKFRRVLGKERINLKGVLERIKSLEENVVEAARKKLELEGKVNALEEEKACLLAEIEALKAIPGLEAKVSSLEPEVAKLKEEKKALEEKTAPSSSSPPTEEAAVNVTPAPEADSVESSAETPAETSVPAEEKQVAVAEEKPCE